MAITNTTFAQTTNVQYNEVNTINGDGRFDSFGQQVSFIGDVNGDSVPDFLATAIGNDFNGENRGFVRAFDGATGNELYTIRGERRALRIGHSISALGGDINGDGAGDFVVSSLRSSPTGIFGQGEVIVFSGADGSRLLSVAGERQSESLGFTVSGAGDVNGDGVVDFMAGTSGTARRNYARVYSGVDASVLHTFAIGTFFDSEVVVSDAGDLNQDGFDDVVVGTPQESTRAGIVRFYSGRDGSTLFTAQGDRSLDRFGQTIENLGDLTGDGISEIAVGANNIVEGLGYFRIFNGADFTIFDEFASSADILGEIISAAGDTNGDGVRDYIVGAPSGDVNGFASGYVAVVSGADRSVIFLRNGSIEAEVFGRSVSSGGDINGDGLADFIASSAKITDVSGFGVVRVFKSSTTATPPTPIQPPFSSVRPPPQGKPPAVDPNPQPPAPQPQPPAPAPAPAPAPQPEPPAQEPEPEPPQASSGAILFSTSTSVNGYADEDIVLFNPSTGESSLYFDGSDVGLARTDIDALAELADGSLLISVNTAIRLGNINVDDSDVLRFIPTSLGQITQGSFSLFIDASDVGLTRNGEDIDSIAVVAEGNNSVLLVSTVGSFSVPGLSGRDEDLARLTVTRTGTTTRGSWSSYFDGSDVSLTRSEEDVWGATLIDGTPVISTRGNFSVSGLTGTGSDLIQCNSFVSGARTLCSLTKILSGSGLGIGSATIDALSVRAP